MVADDLVVLTWFGVEEPLVELSRVVSAETAQALRQGGAERVCELKVEGVAPGLSDLPHGAVVVPVALSRANSGRLQRQLELAGLAFVGSGSRACHDAYDERVLRPLLTRAGIAFTPHLICERSDDVRATAARAVQRFQAGCLIRPTLREAMPVRVPSPESAAIQAALEEVLAAVGAAVIEEAQPQGRRLSLACWLLGERDVCLPAVELIEHRLESSAFCSPGDYDFVCPAVIDAQKLMVLQGIARVAHQALGCVLSRTEVYLDHAGEVTVSACEAAPLLFPTSLFARAAAGAGMDFSELMQRLVAESRQSQTQPP